MNLRERCGCERLPVEVREEFVDGGAERTFDGVDGNGAIEWRHPILQLGEFVGVVGWQKVPACGENLAELDENRSQVFERPTKAHGIRCARPGQQAQGRQFQPPPPPCESSYAGVETVAHHRPGDPQHSEQSAHRGGAAVVPRPSGVVGFRRRSFNAAL